MTALFKTSGMKIERFRPLHFVQSARELMLPVHCQTEEWTWIQLPKLASLSSPIPLPVGVYMDIMFNCVDFDFTFRFTAISQLPGMMPSLYDDDHLTLGRHPSHQPHPHLESYPEPNRNLDPPQDSIYDNPIFSASDNVGGDYEFYIFRDVDPVGRLSVVNPDVASVEGTELLTPGPLREEISIQSNLGGTEVTATGGSEEVDSVGDEFHWEYILSAQPVRAGNRRDEQGDYHWTVFSTDQPQRTPILEDRTNNPSTSPKRPAKRRRIHVETENREPIAGPSSIYCLLHVLLVAAQSSMATDMWPPAGLFFCVVTICFQIAPRSFQAPVKPNTTFLMFTECIKATILGIRLLVWWRGALV
ncbi:hypothetical protein BJ165DRAFT_1562764 [Panaeolus papilionaceus]|nr:hypothetical protein BJ165DRAFT_1562764 [Panaeolus papilionaceus]